MKAKDGYSGQKVTWFVDKLEWNEEKNTAVIVPVPVEATIVLFNHDRGLFNINAEIKEPGTYCLYANAMDLREGDKSDVKDN